MKLHISTMNNVNTFVQFWWNLVYCNTLSHYHLRCCVSCINRSSFRDCIGVYITSSFCYFRLGLQIKNYLFAKLCLLKFPRLSERYQSRGKSIYYYKTFKGQFFWSYPLHSFFWSAKKNDQELTTLSPMHIKCPIMLFWND